MTETPTIPMTPAQLIERALQAQAADDAKREQQRANDAAARAAEQQRRFEQARELLPPEYRPFAFWEGETDDSYGALGLAIPGCVRFALWSKLLDANERVWRWRGLDRDGRRYYGNGGSEEKPIELMVARAHEVAQLLAERAQREEQTAPAPAPAPKPAKNELLQTAAFMLPDDNSDASLATSVASLAYSMHALARHLILLQQPAED